MSEPIVDASLLKLIGRTAPTDAEVFRWFNVDLEPTPPDKDGSGGMGTPCRTPLWKVTRKKRRSKRTKPISDNIKPGISGHKPGENFRIVQSHNTPCKISARADDLAVFYQRQLEIGSEESAFFDDDYLEESA